jgi:RNA polymerase sigma-70 factor (ECF subfamily)
MDMRSDEPELRALMLAGLDGDAAAHRDLLTRLSTHLRAYFKGRLMRMGRLQADAEDLLQETLISIHTRRHTYDRAQPLTPWIYAIARYRLIDHLRQTKVSSKNVPIEAAEVIWASGDTAAVDSRLDLARLLSRLRPRAREAVQMVKIDGLSVAEAAARSGMSPSAIKVSVHRGLKTLSRLVRERSRT